MISSAQIWSWMSYGKFLLLFYYWIPLDFDLNRRQCRRLFAFCCLLLLRTLWFCCLGSNVTWTIEHFTSFNLVPGSSILDNYFQNYVILEKQFWENSLKKQEFQQFHPIFLIFIFLKNNAADIPVLLAQVTTNSRLCLLYGCAQNKDLRPRNKAKTQPGTKLRPSDNIWNSHPFIWS
jgi:hypothetical protein